MTYRDFRKIFKGKIVSVRDNNQFFLSICHDNVFRVYDTKLKTTTRLSTNEALIEFCNYKVTEYTVYDGCLIITVKPM